MHLDRLVLIFVKLSTTILLLICSLSQLLSSNQLEIVLKFSDEMLHPLPDVQVKIPPQKGIYLSNINGIVSLRTEFRFPIKIIASKTGYIEIDTLLIPKPDSDTIFLSLLMFSKQFRSGEIVVTATRTEKEIRSIPIPITTVHLSESNKISIRNLDEILSEFTSIPLVDDHGRGVQLQGLDPDYTLILINGEPIINRTGGILDISRFYIGNANRIEIIRGPNSSIYGSNALAGVINILTSEPFNPMEITASGKYSSFNSLDFALNFAQIPMQDLFSYNFYYNFMRTDGYKLIPSSVGKTIPEIYNHTFHLENFFFITSRSRIKFSIRGSVEDEFNEYLNVSTGTDTISSFNRVKDFSAFLNYKNTISSNFNYEFRTYGSYFSTKTTDRKIFTNTLFDEYEFAQSLYKSEFQGNYLFAENNYCTFGLGYQTETAQSLRIEKGKQKNNQLFFYIQDDFYPIENLNLIGSVRFDKHSDYSSQLSPKLAVSYNFSESITIRTSFGNGFKAPSFEELYLDWSNPMAGYSVFGSINALEGIRRLQNSGQIISLLVPLDSFPRLKPEKSFSFDIGGNISFNGLMFIKLNIFRNNVSNLIDFLPIAYKTNGQRVHTYQNLNRIYTQGIEFSSELSLSKLFEIYLSYQYLETGDLNIIDKIKTKKIFKRDANGFDRAVLMSEYGGLFHRPTHSGNIRIAYNNENLGLYLSIRINLRSKYGFKDINGNGILDDEREYAPGYGIANLNINKTITRMITLNLAVNNIFNKKDIRFLATNPGRTFALSINFNYVKQNTGNNQ